MLVVNIELKKTQTEQSRICSRVLSYVLNVHVHLATPHAAHPHDSLKSRVVGCLELDLGIGPGAGTRGLTLLDAIEVWTTSVWK